MRSCVATVLYNPCNHHFPCTSVCPEECNSGCSDDCNGPFGCPNSQIAQLQFKSPSIKLPQFLTDETGYVFTMQCIPDGFIYTGCELSINSFTICTYLDTDDEYAFYTFFQNIIAKLGFSNAETDTKPAREIPTSPAIQ